MMENDLRADRNRVQIQDRVKLIGIGLLVLLLLSLVSQLYLQINYQSLRHQLEQDLQTIEDQLQYVNQLTALENQAYGQNNDNDPSRSIRSVDRTRRHAPGRSMTIPNFYVKGDGIQSGSAIFLWEQPTGDNQYFNPGIKTPEGRVLSIRVGLSGHYYVFVRVAINGRNPPDGSSLDQSRDYPALGISLKRNSTWDSSCSPCTLVNSFITQDRRGGDYGLEKFPLDSLTASGNFFLEEGDTIFVQPAHSLNNPNGEQYSVTDKRAQFGAFMLEEAMWR